MYVIITSKCNFWKRIKKLHLVETDCHIPARSFQWLPIAFRIKSPPLSLCNELSMAWPSLPPPLALVILPLARHSQSWGLLLSFQLVRLVSALQTFVTLSSLPGVCSRGHHLLRSGLRTCSQKEEFSVLLPLSAHPASCSA